MKKALFIGIIAFLSSITAAQAQEPAVAPTQAPAAAVVPKPAWMEYRTSYAGEENDLTNPHRTGEEIAIWAQQAAADVLSFTQADYTTKMAGYQKYFLPGGWALYSAYLKDTKMENMVMTEGYSVATIVSDTPDIVNRGAAGGAYHWIVRMPLTISFYRQPPEGAAQPGPSGKFTLFMDVGRVPVSAEDSAGVAISNWRVDNVSEP